MITVAVLALLAGVAVPYVLANLPTYRVNGAARQLVGDFRLAKTLSVERGRDVFLQFDPAGGTYTVVVDTNNNGALDASPTDEEVKAVSIQALYDGVAFGSGAATSTSGGAVPADGVSFDHDLAVFHPGGGAEAGTAYLQPARDAGTRTDRNRAVTVTVTTGRARAYRWEGGSWE